MANLTIEYGSLFRKEFANFPVKDQDAIVEFVEHIQNFGFTNLEGRNKSSDNVHKNDPHFAQKVKYARENHLWHYHIGILAFDLSKPFGDRTSEYVLHYQRVSDRVKIVDYSAHPSFNLPTASYLR
ncbi:hypothetical protein Q7267_09105 [Glaesserella parasuis]|uniref:hypothetical protein n=1 Tax=Glaesserella parasuis TaxID=738 RepID=UPI0013217EB3|nr:hypothetical protein [Glaesserella parasuis]MDO9676726.1 hypothetical protein [Glaesserella parasuis]MDO9692603.1 hypothetical protein [Glaesserella parasuis]MDO9949153.1 hypothetical protein [Glaesserella parasuis]MDP0144443.1 hypothetical protein [Glaesserella parasuis]MDP0271145.1 hypothetical protein [Glaesserella parasuis]